ncbi:hypothetical protein EO244_14100 [Ancylomarina salipaludis]|uniref:Uncharacterized protein n=1 Tax=Ancylomarina salipaludis TaxID=2501299 RepID=A0A4Q1JJU5_9BACT|nr:hypothetical protein [Ancylomarina salipaludis]RXQ89495.1 hypothetical protein EO244_14100 [Ancylomarina salipaludis]
MNINEPLLKTSLEGVSSSIIYFMSMPFRMRRYKRMKFLIDEYKLLSETKFLDTYIQKQHLLELEAEIYCSNQKINLEYYQLKSYLNFYNQYAPVISDKLLKKAIPSIRSFNNNTLEFELPNGKAATYILGAPKVLIVILFAMGAVALMFGVLHENKIIGLLIDIGALFMFLMSIVVDRAFQSIFSAQTIMRRIELYEQQHQKGD